MPDLSSPWIIVAAVVFALFLMNGTIAYVYKSRRMRSQGQEPPPFLQYLFFPKPLPTDVKVPRPVRLVLGLVVLAGGVFFVLVGGMILYHPPSLRGVRELTVLGFFVLISFICLGAAICYVGIRLMVVKNDEPLFKRSNTQTDGSEQSNPSP